MTPTKISRRGAVAALASAAALASGCAAIDSTWQAAKGAVGLGPKPTTPDWKSLTITAADDANQNSPVAIDVVFVREQTLVEQLATTPASRWFAARGDIVKSFPEGISVLSYELVPRQSIRVPFESFKDQKAWAVLAFASYPPPGDHRERMLLTAEAYLVQLGAKGFKAGAVKPAAAR
ncbi:hypothetical protein [Ramlibacter sp.]|uniref:hypothetical protein n=1 Tax=Ramlibacter sp. TaxID=1917967 RepID=UPI003D14DB4C